MTEQSSDGLEQYVHPVAAAILRAVLILVVLLAAARVIGFRDTIIVAVAFLTYEVYYG